MAALFRNEKGQRHAVPKRTKPLSLAGCRSAKRCRRTWAEGSLPPLSQHATQSDRQRPLGSIESKACFPSQDLVIPLVPEARDMNGMLVPPWVIGGNVKRIEFDEPNPPDRPRRIIRSKEFAKATLRGFHIETQNCEPELKAYYYSWQKKSVVPLASSCLASKKMNSITNPMQAPWVHGANVSPCRPRRDLRSEEFANIDMQHSEHEVGVACQNTTSHPIRGILRKDGHARQSKPKKHIAWNDFLQQSRITPYRSPKDVSILWHQALVIECNRCDRQFPWANGSNFSAFVGAPGRSHFAQWWTICQDCGATNPYMNGQITIDSPKCIGAQDAAHLSATKAQQKNHEKWEPNRAAFLD